MKIVLRYIASTQKNYLSSVTKYFYFVTLHLCLSVTLEVAKCDLDFLELLRVSLNVQRACNENIHKFDILLMLILLAFEYAHIYVGYLKTPTSSKRIECASNVNTY